MHCREKNKFTEYRDSYLFARKYKLEEGNVFGYQELRPHTEDFSDLVVGINFDGDHYLISERYVFPRTIDGVPRRFATKAWKMVWYDNHREFAAGIRVNDDSLVCFINLEINRFEEGLE